MKIALVILRGEPSRGGAERYTADLAAALAARGHEVSLLASRFGAPIPGVSQVALPADGITRLAGYEKFLQSLRRHRAEHPFDIVHAMLPAPGCDLYHPHAHLAAESIASGHRRHAGAIRRQLTHIGNALNRKRRRFAEVEREMLSAKSPPVILCLSDLIAQAARQRYPSANLRLEKLFNAVDLMRFDPAKADGAAVRKQFHLAGDDTVALMIAQDFQRKGVRQAIAALAKLVNPKLKLLIVGKPDPRMYRRQAAELHVADQVIFAGATDHPADFYAAADFFVLPTLHDPCSLVVLEALAMGVPVISTRQNGACEAMVEAKHGFALPDAHDVDRLADAMRELCDSHQRQAMREHCLELRPRLSFSHHVDRLLEIYAKTKEPSPRPSP